MYVPVTCTKRILSTCSCTITTQAMCSLCHNGVLPHQTEVLISKTARLSHSCACVCIHVHVCHLCTDTELTNNPFLLPSLHTCCMDGDEQEGRRCNDK